MCDYRRKDFDSSLRDGRGGEERGQLNERQVRFRQEIIATLLASAICMQGTQCGRSRWIHECRASERTGWESLIAIAYATRCVRILR